MGIKGDFKTFLASALNDGRDLLLNQDEKTALDKFKLQVRTLTLDDYMKSDYYLIRWLRAAKLSVPQALLLLEQNIQWRKANNISTILSEDFSDVAEDFPITFPGHDKDGRPIFTLDVSEWDLRKAALQGKIPRIQRYLTRNAEQCMQNILQAQRNYKGGKPVTRQLILIDVEGFNAFQHACVSCVAVYANFGLVGATYYPMINDEIILINAPEVARITINTLRTLLPETERETIKVFNLNKSVWQNYLNKRIDRAQRSKRYGGTQE